MSNIAHQMSREGPDETRIMHHVMTKCLHTGDVRMTLTEAGQRRINNTQFDLDCD